MKRIILTIALSIFLMAQPAGAFTLQIGPGLEDAAAVYTEVEYIAEMNIHPHHTDYQTYYGIGEFEIMVISEPGDDPTQPVPVQVTHTPGVRFSISLNNYLFGDFSPEDYGIKQVPAPSTEIINVMPDTLHCFSNTIGPPEPTGIGMLSWIDPSHITVIDPSQDAYARIYWEGWSQTDFSLAAPVPEPATMLLFGAGILGAGGLIRRKK